MSDKEYLIINNGLIMGNNKVGFGKDINYLLGKTNNCQTNNEVLPITSQESCQTIKLRDFQRNMNKYMNGDYYIVNGEGKIVLTVYKGKHIESNNGGLTFEEHETLYEMFNMLEKVKLFTDSHSN